ncbi:hypothetical protein L227DRAFT_617828 [Lentinus tigrinus ALCF2SS1-6]|uniref:Uncharacterized protein n=1 Tax=Lentinus tigrinus ALCF2SS1-6 TaxID=1328759 RepID=A0A5C2RMT8_9APHY|nr:hypothetical protein L227DRAFT_618040 [Lentinus tigrinus ALCF2SS1-6]RPD52430.1 hypothetical protein L227DRAFT_617828 [Lentinus tigrinus ALCF2SS1-6]
MAASSSWYTVLMHGQTSDTDNVHGSTLAIASSASSSSLEAAFSIDAVGDKTSTRPLPSADSSI